MDLLRCEQAEVYHGQCKHPHTLILRSSFPDGRDFILSAGTNDQLKAWIAALWSVVDELQASGKRATISGMDISAAGQEQMHHAKRSVSDFYKSAPDEGTVYDDADAIAESCVALVSLAAALRHAASAPVPHALRSGRAGPPGARLSEHSRSSTRAGSTNVVVLR